VIYKSIPSTDIDQSLHTCFLANLGGGASVTVLMDIDFNDTTQPAQFQICTHSKAFNVSITAPVGELLQPNTITENDFLKLQGECPTIEMK